MTKCYLCEKGNLKKKMVDYNLYGVNLGKFNAEACEKCGEIFFDEQTSKKRTEKAKKEGLWGLNANTKTGQSGSTLDIRLPKKIIEFLNLKKGEEVDIQPEGKNRLVITING